MLVAVTAGAAVIAGSPIDALAATPWSVTPDGGGYRVTLHLDRPLPGRDALPEIAIDGRSVGAAQQSADGRALTVVTADPAAAHPSSVRLAWNGRAGENGWQHVPVDAASDISVPKSSVAMADPTAPGPYQVQRADYDLGNTALTLSGLGGKAVEEQAAVWVPTSAPGQRPVAVFLHGRHDSCYQAGTTNSTDDVWPCPSGWEPIPSYLGFNQAAQTLAGDGYVVVSISANGVNAQDNAFAEDAGALARAQLILDHLDLLAAANMGKVPGLSPLLKGRLDLGNVALMGHSRGGEGVAKAALLNAARPHPYGIRGALLVAPVDYARETLPGIPMVVVLPYCDGDVPDLRGQHFYDDTRYADTNDHVLRSSLLMMGANHNFFNTQWTPGLSTAPAFDDWDAEADPSDPTCGSTQPTTTRLTAAQQSQAGTSLIVGFFRLVQGHETTFLPMFDDASAPAISVGAATVLQEDQSPQRLDVAPLQTPSSSVAVPPTGTYCASMEDASPQSGLPSCTGSPDNSRFPSFTPTRYAQNVTASPMLHLSAAGTVTTAVKDHDISAYSALTVRASTDDAGLPTRMTMTVTDGTGRHQSSPAITLNPLPGSGTILPKTWLPSWRWPTSQMSQVNIHDIRQVSLSTSGAALLSDVAFQTPSAGDGGPSTLPQASITGTTVNEGDGGAMVTVHLSRASSRPVLVNIQAVAGTGTQIAGAAQQLSIPAGRVTAPVRIPIVDDTTTEETPDTTYLVVLSDTTNAIANETFAHVVVHDDDLTH